MKSKYIILIGFLAIVILSTSGCRKITGINGNSQVKSEYRQLLSFDKVRNEGTFNVYIKQDSLFSAVVEAESNLIPYIRTLVNGNTLIIDTRENLQNNQPINIYVTTPVIHGAKLSGSGYIFLDSLDTDNMDIELSGSGRINGYANTNYTSALISGSGIIDLDSYTQTMDALISGSGDLELLGEASNGNFTISGSGSIRSYNYLQNECIAKISGSGNMQLNVEDYLDITISGSGSVYYVGNPSINVKITGSGQVIKQ